MPGAIRRRNRYSGFKRSTHRRRRSWWIKNGRSYVLSALGQDKRRSYLRGTVLIFLLLPAIRGLVVRRTLPLSLLIREELSPKVPLVGSLLLILFGLGSLAADEGIDS